MSGRAFPVVYSRDVVAAAQFYGRLGWVERLRSPDDHSPTFVAMIRGNGEMAISAGGTSAAGPSAAPAPAVELFVFVDDLAATLEELRGAGVAVVAEPVRMPWGEQVARVADPDGNRVALVCAD